VDCVRRHDESIRQSLLLLTVVDSAALSCLSHVRFCRRFCVNAAVLSEFPGSQPAIV